MQNIGKEFKVCVICTTFNHGKYVSDCLDGFVRQETDFPKVFIVIDDCSTDNTQEIIQKYSSSNKEIIPILLPYNHYSVQDDKYKYMQEWLERSEYVAFCEGDDYWTDCYKLQKQVDVLEQHTSCNMCVHRTEKVDVNKQSTNSFFPSAKIKNSILSSRQSINLLCDDFSFHLTSMLIKSNLYIAYYQNKPEFAKVAKCGDVPLLLYFGQLGDIYYLNETMSCYRTFSVGSHTDRLLVDSKYRTAFYDSIYKMISEFNKYTHNKYSKLTNLISSRYRILELQLQLGANEITREQYNDEISKDYLRVYLFRHISLKSRLFYYVERCFPLIARFYKHNK